MEISGERKSLSVQEARFEVVVVGGGMSGLCAAIASARHGARTALVHDRPVLGGNASSEIRMHICGALGVGHNRPDSRETGIVEEILLENAFRNPQHSYSIFDTILWEKARFQPGLELYLNTHMHSVDKDEDSETVRAIWADQLTTEKRFHIHGAQFIDATGDGLLAVLAGCQFMQGRESSNAYGESLAPEQSDTVVMGNTVLFQAKRMESPVAFTRPSWAYQYTLEDFKERNFDDITSGYWWVELGGSGKDVIRDGEFLRDELLKTVYGVWDYIKNSGAFDAGNLALDWVGFLPGKRESRRIVGQMVLTENDLVSGVFPDDTVAFGGWPIDLHIPKGIESKGAPTHFNHLNSMYAIPLRCLRSRDVSNLFLAGRAISVSHVAFGSTRVMATCAVVGQAVGTAAALCIAHKKSSADLQLEVEVLRQLLLRDDCYIPGVRSADAVDPILKASSVNASSWIPGGEPSLVINGVSRRVGDSHNCWISAATDFSRESQWLTLVYDHPVPIGSIDLCFDSNLSRENMLSISETVMQKFHQGLPPELVRSYEIVLRNTGDVVHTIIVDENHLRHRAHQLPQPVMTDSCTITVLATHGDPHARIFSATLCQARN